MNGTDVLLLVNTGTVGTPVYEAVGSQRDVTFSEKTETVDMSSKDGRAKRVDPGRYSATLSLDALYVPTNADYEALRSAMRDGEKILVAREVQGVTTETADAVITGLDESFPDQGEATIAISLEIDGDWVEVGT